MAFWLGIVTSITPCSMTLNVVAISYMSRRVGNAVMSLLSGLVYTIARSLTYAVLAMLLAACLLSAPGLSHFLQKYINKLLGPILILTGMFLLRLIEFNVGGGGMSDSTRKRVDSLGIIGAGFLGILFALSFCPLEAMLFFGSLIPLAVKHNSCLLLPILYGIGTALPVCTFAVLIAFGANAVGRGFDMVKKIDYWARLITGWLLIASGIYLSLVYIYGIFA
jgi:cytochrome c biogenesis protein CcdA